MTLTDAAPIRARSRVGNDHAGMRGTTSNNLYNWHGDLMPGTAAVGPLDAALQACVAAFPDTTAVLHHAFTALQQSDFTRHHGLDRTAAKLARVAWRRPRETGGSHSRRAGTQRKTATRCRLTRHRLIPALWRTMPMRPKARSRLLWPWSMKALPLGCFYLPSSLFGWLM